MDRDLAGRAGLVPLVAPRMERVTPNHSRSGGSTRGPLGPVRILRTVRTDGRMGSRGIPGVFSVPFARAKGMPPAGTYFRPGAAQDGGTLPQSRPLAVPAHLGLRAAASGGWPRNAPAGAASSEGAKDGGTDCRVASLLAMTLRRDEGAREGALGMTLRWDGRRRVRDAAPYGDGRRAAGVGGPPRPRGNGSGALRGPLLARA